MHVMPLVFFVGMVLLLLLAGGFGAFVRAKYPELIGVELEMPFTGLQAAVLALLGLLLGFSFSMAVGRFEERRSAQVEEANAIGTSYLRVGTLEDGIAAQQRDLMAEYVRERVDYLQAGVDLSRLQRAVTGTAELQGRMWANALRSEAVQRRDPVSNAYLSSLTEVFDAAERMQSASENRIPTTAWVLLTAVAAISSFLVGMGMRRWNSLLLLTLPFVVAATLALIDDIDSPGSGLIRQPRASMERVQQQIQAGPGR